MKSLSAVTAAGSGGPTPHGVGGLKCIHVAELMQAHESHPSRGGWIEITMGREARIWSKSHPSRGGWIEICKR